MGKSNPRYTEFDATVLAEMSRHADPRLAMLFACKVRVDATGCWLWIAGKDKDGYGIFSWFVGKDENGKKVYRSERAHRFAFRSSHGWVPAELDHLTCDRKPCVHPCHCVPTTTAENIARTENRAALNAKKTLCKRGHELSAHPSNPKWRHCETCRAMTRRGPIMATNTSGHRWVSWHSRSGKWIAKIKRGEKTYWIGRYRDPNQAAIAVQEFCNKSRIGAAKS